MRPQFSLRCESSRSSRHAWHQTAGAEVCFVLDRHKEMSFPAAGISNKKSDAKMFCENTKKVSTKPRREQSAMEAKRSTKAISPVHAPASGLPFPQDSSEYIHRAFVFRLWRFIHSSDLPGNETSTKKGEKRSGLSISLPATTASADNYLKSLISQLL